MTYEEALAVAGTRAEFERRMAIHNTMDTVAHIILVVSVAALVWLAWQEIRHRKELKRLTQERAQQEQTLHSFGSNHYLPTVTGDRQIVNGVEFVRMGPPTEWRD